MTADEILDAPRAGAPAGAPQMSADALLDTPLTPGPGAVLLGNEDLGDRTDRTDQLPGKPLVPAAEGFSVDMGAGQAADIRDRVVGEQLKKDDERLNARVFKPGDNPWRVVDGEMIVDPERFGLATDMMWRYGVIDSDRYAKMLAAAPDVEAVAARRKDLERRAGEFPELKAALEGAGVSGAAIAGGMAAGATAGRMLAGAPKPVAVGGTLLVGTLGALASASAADRAVEEVAKFNEAADSLLAAKELKPGYNLAGSLATIAIPVPGALRNVSTAINTIRAEKGAAEATKFAAAVLGGGAAFGASVDAGSQVAHQKIFDALHPELQPMLQAEMERQAAEQGKLVERRPEFSPGSVGVSATLGALTAGMGVKAQNRVYSPEELVALEGRVLSQRASREEVQDFNVMRRAVLTLRNDEGLLAADGVRRATVDVFGSPVLDVTEIVNPEFRKAALTNAEVGMRSAEVPALREVNPNPMAGVPGAGEAPVYQGQNFVDRGGPGPVFAGGTNEIAGGGIAAGALPGAAGALPSAGLRIAEGGGRNGEASVPSPAGVSADDLLDGVKIADGGLRSAEVSSSWDRFQSSTANAQAAGQVPYIEVQRDLGEGRSEQVAFDLQGNEIARARSVTGLSKLFSKRKDIYGNVSGGFFKLPKGVDFSVDWMKGEMDRLDAMRGSVPSPAAVPVVTEPEVVTPAEAEIKVGNEIKTARVDQSKPVPKVIRDEVIDQLDAELKTVTETGRNKGTVNISIPGDGSFKIKRTQPALETAIKRLSGLSTRIGQTTAKARMNPPTNADDVIAAYGGPEKAFVSVNRQMNALDPKDDRTEAGKLADDIFKSTKAGILQAQADSKIAETHKWNAWIKDSQQEIDRINGLKRRTKDHELTLDLESKRIAGAREKIAGYQKQADELQAQADVEKALLDEMVLAGNVSPDTRKSRKGSKVMADMGPVEGGSRKAEVGKDGLLFDVPPVPEKPVATEYTTDAQVYADFPDAVGVYRSSGGWRMPIILGATDLVPVVEMPEIIELWRELTGAVPGIKAKMGDKLGYFMPAGSGSVVLRADLFQNEKSALMTLMHEVGHGFHYMDSGKMARGNILGIIAGLVNHMGHAIPAAPGVDPLGVEGYGFSGKAITKAERAEIIAKAEADLIASLEGEVRRVLMEVPVYAESGVTPEMVKGMFGTDARESWPEIYDWFARQDAATKKKIVLAAMRGAVDPMMDHLKARVQVGTETVEQEVNTGRAPTPEELRAAFDYALRAEMDARNIVDLKYVRDELVALTRWWKPYDHRDAKKRAYRESGAELYADAMSVLLNSPADLKARAPVFWRAWWAYLDARPAVKAKLMEVQSRILSGREAVLSKREALAKEGFATGAEMFLRKQAEATARRTQLAGWWEDLKDQYWDKFYPLTSAAARARAAGKITHAEEDGIRWMLEEHPMADGMLQVKLADIGRIFHGLDDARIPRADLGYLMSLQRIANERIVLEQDDETGEVTKVTGRSVMANPGGETARTAQEQMDRLRSIWGEEKWGKVTGAAKDFREIFLSVMEEGHKAGLYSDDTWGRIVANADVYAAFTPVKYVQEFLPAAIRKQVGTFEQIADPVQQTTLKMIAVWRAAKNNAFIAGAVREVGRVLPEAVRDAPMKYDGKRMVPQAPKESGWRLVTWMEGGKTQGVHMVERFARMWERQSPADRDAILRVLMTGFTNTVYSAIIRYNPAFQLFMSPARDLQRSLTNMPGGVKGRARFVARLMDPQVWGASVDWARGDVGRTALLREMIETSAVGGPHTAFGGRMGTPDDALDGMLKKFHVQNDHKARGIFLNGLMSPFRAIEFAGQVLQLLPKVSAYKVLSRDMEWSQGQAANMIRNHIGIPNYYKKGRHVSAAGSLVPFLNIFLRGYDSLVRTARGAERGQSAGAWWLAWMLTGGGLITVLQTLAREGMLGDDLKKLYERIPEWDMTNYMNLPLGEVPTGAMGGKTVYARLPMDEGLRVINATVHKALTAAIRSARGDKVQPGVGDVVTGVSATVPGINPLLAVGSAWKSYAEGQNPRDDFRNRDILTEDEWRAGGWPAVSKMMGWTLGQTGITNFFTYDRNADSLREMVIGSTPVVNRVIKITDRGLAQSEEAQQRADDAVMARVRAQLPADVQGLRTEYYWLQRRGDRMNDEQMNRYGELSLWMKLYRRSLADVETYLEMKEPNMAAQVLRDLRSESKEYRAR